MIIVPGRVSAKGAVWWAFRVDGPERIDRRAFVLERLDGGAQPVEPLVVWRLATNAEAQAGSLFGRAHLVAARGLVPDTRYRLRAVEDGTRVETRTLPERLRVGERLTVAATSCMCRGRSDGVDRAWPPRDHGPDDPDPVRFRFLMGDQLYLDLAEDDGGPLGFPTEPDVKYVRQWTDPRYARWLSQAPNLAIPDDHEFWNDFPWHNFWPPWSGDERYGERADRALSVFQSALNVDADQLEEAMREGAAKPLSAYLADEGRSFGFDVAPLSFFVLDTRSRRTRAPAWDLSAAPATTAGGAPAGDWIDRAVAWAGGLAGPGVLVLSQQLITKPGDGGVFDKCLADYRRDFSRLWSALANARHDCLVFAGDVHWSRFASAEARPGRFVHELTASPLALLKIGSLKVPPEEGGAVRFLDGGTERTAPWTRRWALAPNRATATVTFEAGYDGASVAATPSLHGLDRDGSFSLLRAGPTVVLR